MAMVRLIVITSLLSCAALPQATVTPRSSANSALNTDEIVGEMVRRNRIRVETLLSFEGRRFYALEYTGFPGKRHAEMVVNVTYHAPDTKEFKVVSQSGSGWLVDRVLTRLLASEKEGARDHSRIDLTPENYDFALLGYDSSVNGGSYILSVEPKKKYKYLYRGKIWVDRTDFAIARLEVAPAVSPSFWTKKTEINTTYTKVGDFWLPLENRTVTNVRLGGHAVLTIHYRDYRITQARAPADASAASMPN